ncbi:MAG: 50S ribosomal protein L2 [Candidatus Omnitrophica bacterium]|nr:50S ribosomal protein L2 [Candidatus Omnitrophota bacterium]
MAVKTHRPTTPTMRFQVTPSFDEVTRTQPEKRLLSPLPHTGGRNAHGHITSRFRGGGHKRMYRHIDFFRRDKAGVAATVRSIEYDPNRNARIALLEYADGERRYILWPDGVRVGDAVSAGDQAEIKLGNAMALRQIPTGQPIHCIELQQRRGGQIVRTAGSAAFIQAKEGEYAHVKLPSGEIRLISLECWATLGQLGNAEYKNLVYGKAGRSRWFGKKPHVRGVAMNPVNHPHGGGEGKSGQGNPHPVSPWGWHTKGRKTRSRTKYSRRFIVKRRR